MKVKKDRIFYKTAIARLKANLTRLDKLSNVTPQQKEELQKIYKRQLKIYTHEMRVLF